jgi:hypothetical protein
VAKAQLTNPVFELVDRIRSAGRTGRRLHLDPEHVKLLMGEDVYLVLSRLEAREMQRLSVPDQANDSSSENSGCGSAPSASLGTSVGSNEIPPAAVSRGASQLLRTEVARTLRRKKQSMHSLHTM